MICTLLSFTVNTVELFYILGIKSVFFDTNYSGMFQRYLRQGIRKWYYYVLFILYVRLMFRNIEHFTYCFQRKFGLSGLLFIKCLSE